MVSRRLIDKVRETSWKKVCRLRSQELNADETKGAERVPVSDC